MQIPILRQNPGFADDVFTLNIDQVDPLNHKYLVNLKLFQEGVITGSNYPFTVNLAFPSSADPEYSIKSTETQLADCIDISTAANEENKAEFQLLGGIECLQDLQNEEISFLIQVPRYFKGFIEISPFLLSCR